MRRAIATRLLLPLLTAAVLISSWSPVAAAQELEAPKPRQGMFVSLGAYGMIDINHDVEEGWYPPWPGVAGSLRFGEALADWFDLGLGIEMGGGFGQEHSSFVGHVSIEAALRPIEPLFARLAVGFGWVDVTRRVSGSEQIIGSVGGAYGLTLGYDFFPGHDGSSGGLALTPVAWFEASPADPLTTLVAGIGLEITWWFGLSKDKLDLSFEESYQE